MSAHKCLQCSFELAWSNTFNGVGHGLTILPTYEHRVRLCPTNAMKQYRA